jgi:eukaryotic-like serine/threonine-protein kinase
VKIDVQAPTVAEPGRGDDVVGKSGGTLGKYRLERMIGAGGMGMVWAAYDPDLERQVAIKLLRDSGEAALRTRLLREARAMARLKHPNVVAVYDVGTDGNRDYIAMELVDGSDFTEWLATKPPRAEILAALLAAGRGLAAAHDAGLVHRDFKPHNVLRAKDGGVFVTDFGLARGQVEAIGELELAPAGSMRDVRTGATPGRPLDSVLDSALTQTGVLIGTPAYMAPEQFAGRAPDPRTDQFAFCVTAWEALAGSRPFTGGTLDELKAAAESSTRAPGAELPPRIRAILARGLDPRHDARWPDMRALLGALEAAIAPPRRRWQIPAVIAAVALVATGTTVMVMRQPPTPPTTPTPPKTHSWCASVEETFDQAWSPAKSAAVVGKLGTRAAGVVAILDRVRGAWITAYKDTCAHPESATRHAKVACLLSVRDEVVKEAASLDRSIPRDKWASREDPWEPDVDDGALAMLLVTINSCGTVTAD